MKIKTIQLLGKPVFSSITIPDLVNMHTKMPEDEAAFVFILKGKCNNYTETEVLHLSPNQAILAKCGNSTFETLVHDESPEYQALTVKFHKSILEQIYNVGESPFSAKVNYTLQCNSTAVKVNGLIEQFVRGVQQMFEYKHLLTDELIVLKIKELISILLTDDNSIAVLAIMHNLFQTKTFEFKEIIRSHICSPIRLIDLAKLTNHSLSSFKKEFKKIYNDTPNRYLINKRIELVAQTLINSDDTLSNIAYDCEFKTLAHMSRVFKNRYGITPSAYRLNRRDKL